MFGRRSARPATIADCSVHLACAGEHTTLDWKTSKRTLCQVHFAATPRKRRWRMGGSRLRARRRVELGFLVTYQFQTFSMGMFSSLKDRMTDGFITTLAMIRRPLVRLTGCYSPPPPLQIGREGSDARHSDPILRTDGMRAPRRSQDHDAEVSVAVAGQGRAPLAVRLA